MAKVKSVDEPLIDNFPHEAPLRERYEELRGDDPHLDITSRTRSFKAFADETIMWCLANGGFPSTWSKVRLDDCRAFMRVTYERDSDERVDVWDDYHADMFRLRYGFDLYP